MFTLFAKKNYDMPLPGKVDRAMTIAAFRVAQGGRQDLTAQPMRRDVLTFLTSSTAVNYWLNNRRWLEKNLDNPKLLQLTSAGLVEIANSLSGHGHNPASEDDVQEWLGEMQNGGARTDDGPKEFQGELIPDVEPSSRLTESEARLVMVNHYQENKSAYPDSVKSQESREQLMALLMDGMAVEDAFSQVIAKLDSANSPAE